MATKYRKKPVAIEAMRWGGLFLLDGAYYCRPEEWIPEENFKFENEELYLVTLEGLMKVSVGDYVIKGVKGEFYPCKPDIFVMTYEAVNTDD